MQALYFFYPWDHELEPKKKQKNRCLAGLGNATLLCKNWLHSSNLWEISSKGFPGKSIHLFLYLSSSVNQFSSCCEGDLLWHWQGYKPQIFKAFGGRYPGDWMMFVMRADVEGADFSVPEPDRSPQLLSQNIQNLLGTDPRQGPFTAPAKGLSYSINHQVSF